MKRKNVIAIASAILVMVFAACLSACGGSAAPRPTTPYTSSGSSIVSGNTSSSGSSASSSSSFKNEYGTPTTKCAHPGCTNYIASSGDTNCCETHSNRCLECKKYIDEDATYCMSCLTKAISSNTSSSGSSVSSSSSFKNEYGTPTTKCAHPGCTNYIASSGDTNCCETHSNRCLECKKYIDEDATYCMDCLLKALSG